MKKSKNSKLPNFKKRGKILFSGIIISLFFFSPSASFSTEYDQTYLIGPEDVLGISVWKDTDLTLQVVVRPDGRISFPLIGDVKAAGHSVEWLRNEIKKRISEYVPDAVVSVLLMEVKGIKIYVVGKVARSGGASVGRRINVMQAIAGAGGLTKFAGESSILILRNDNGGQTKIPFNYNEVKKGTNIEQNIWLQDGDVIVVP